MTVFIPYFMWDGDRRIEVRSLEELDQAVAEVLTQANHEGLPIAVQVAVNEETELLVTIGGEESHMEFYSAMGTPIAVGCRGPWESDEMIKFTHSGIPSEMKRRYFVPKLEALQALHEYFLYGTRPSNVQWGS
jgi:hypothetical protein